MPPGPPPDSGAGAPQRTARPSRHNANGEPLHGGSPFAVLCAVTPRRQGVDEAGAAAGALLLLDDEAADEDESPPDELLEEADSAELLLLEESDDEASDFAAPAAGSASLLVELVLFL